MHPFIAFRFGSYRITNEKSFAEKPLFSIKNHKFLNFVNSTEILAYCRRN